MVVSSVCTCQNCIGQDVAVLHITFLFRSFSGYSSLSSVHSFATTRYLCAHEVWGWLLLLLSLGSLQTHLCCCLCRKIVFSTAWCWSGTAAHVDMYNTHSNWCLTLFCDRFNMSRSLQCGWRASVKCLPHGLCNMLSLKINWRSLTFCKCEILRLDLWGTCSLFVTSINTVTLLMPVKGWASAKESLVVVVPSWLQNAIDCTLSPLKNYLHQLNSAQLNTSRPMHCVIITALIHICGWDGGWRMWDVSWEPQFWCCLCHVHTASELVFSASLSHRSPK